MNKVKLVILVMVIGLLAVACGRPGEEIEGRGFRYIHDEEHQVGCWTVRSGLGVAMHCLPDSQYALVE